jgi:hypothetical protein
MRVCRVLRRANQLVCQNELAAAIDTRESAIKITGGSVLPSRW